MRPNTPFAAKASARPRATACTAAAWARPVAIAFIGADGTPWTPPQFGTGRLGPVEIRINSPAGGGWGDPKKRDPDLVLRDVRDGM